MLGVQHLAHTPLAISGATRLLNKQAYFSYHVCCFNSNLWSAQVAPYNTSPFGGCETRISANCRCDEAYPLNSEYTIVVLCRILTNDIAT